MTKKHICMTLLLAAVLPVLPAVARDQIKIAGSSTVMPYAQIVSETFGEIYPEFKTPVIESGGSSAGFKELCRGVGPQTIDIADASRAIFAGERAACQANGVDRILEIKFGYDGVVFATNASMPGFSLNAEEIYQAIAANLVVDGKLVPNPNMRWSDIRETLPDTPIDLFIPGEKHGTRAVLEETILATGCAESGAVALLDRDVDAATAHELCVAVRKDGKAIDIDGDYTAMLMRVDADRNAMGVFGLPFFENNAARLNVVRVDGVIPSIDTIADGSYPISRPLYFYVKEAHLDAIPGLAEYVDFFLSESMIGPHGPLADYGLVPAPAREREQMRALAGAAERNEKSAAENKG